MSGGVREIRGKSAARNEKSARVFAEVFAEVFADLFAEVFATVLEVRIRIEIHRVICFSICKGDVGPRRFGCHWGHLNPVTLGPFQGDRFWKYLCSTLSSLVTPCVLERLGPGRPGSWATWVLGGLGATGVTQIRSPWDP